MSNYSRDGLGPSPLILLVLVPVAVKVADTSFHGTGL